MLHILVQCPSLTNPNGSYRCNLGSDGVISYEDICQLLCNTGFEPNNTATRTCQSDGSWSGTEDVCRRSACLIKYICLPISEPVE